LALEVHLIPTCIPQQMLKYAAKILSPHFGATTTIDTNAPEAMSIWRLLIAGTFVKSSVA
jgi:hypothetical protein